MKERTKEKMKVVPRRTDCPEPHFPQKVQYPMEQVVEVRTIELR